MSRRTKAAIAIAGLAMASAQAPPMPTAVEVTGSNMCQVGPGWEYAPVWQIKLPDGGNELRTKVDAATCAAECEALGYCMGASWVEWEDGNHKCFLKAFPAPPKPSAYPCYKGDLEGKTVYALVMKTGATCADQKYADEYTTAPPTCKEQADLEMGMGAEPFIGLAASPMGAPATGPEIVPVEAPVEIDPVSPPAPMVTAPVPAEEPAATPVGGAAPPTTPTPIETGNATYMMYPGRDYIPKGNDTLEVTVEDVGPGVVVESEAACASECDTRTGCSAASYYGQVTADWPGGKNCWPKMLGDTCELPSDAIVDPKATLLLLEHDECDEAPTPAPAGTAPVAAAPPLSPPGATGTTPETSGTRSTPIPPPQTGGVSAGFAGAGAAVMAAAALLL